MEEITEYTVSRLSALIKNTLEKSFSNIVLRAEISSLKVSTLGHVYLSLKDSDSDSVINAVCWKGIVQKSSVKLEVGMEMRFFGSITTFPSQSKYNFQIKTIGKPLTIMFHQNNHCHSWIFYVFFYG